METILNKPQEGEPVVKRPAEPALTAEAVAEEEPKRKTKIDPKKLIVYSEIMKPTF